MNIETKIEGTTSTFLLEGKVDTLTAPELSEAIEGLETEVQTLVLDFERVSYISSAGLRALLNAHKEMQKQDGNMEIVGVNDAVRAVFTMTGFDTILSIH